MLRKKFFIVCINKLDSFLFVGKLLSIEIQYDKKFFL